MGGYSWISLYAMTGKELKRAAIRGTITKSASIGEVLISNMSNEIRMREICKITGGSLLGEGKISNITRTKYKKFYGGKIEITGKEKIKIIFQNEYLLAENDARRVAVPDIITLLNKETLKPISTEEIKYGEDVYILTIPSDKKWKTKKGLEIVGPEAFNLEGIQL